MDIYLLKLWPTYPVCPYVVHSYRHYFAKITQRTALHRFVTRVQLSSSLDLSISVNILCRPLTSG